MWCSERRRFLLLGVELGLGALALAACGFQPLYGTGSPAAGMQGTVAVDVIPGGPGFAMRERLTERLGPANAPGYRLAVDFDLDSRGAALTQQDYTTRYNVTGVARYRLYPIGSDVPALSGEVTSFTAYSAPDSETASAFATRTAEQDAEIRLARTLADQIVLRLAVTAGARP